MLVPKTPSGAGQARLCSSATHLVNRAIHVSQGAQPRPHTNIVHTKSEGAVNVHSTIASVGKPQHTKGVTKHERKFKEG